MKLKILACCMALWGLGSVVDANPPFGGTVYADPDIFTGDDPSTLQSVDFRRVITADRYDHRFEDSENPEVRAKFFRFVARYPRGQRVTFEVNTEFEDLEYAGEVAETYAFILGQMPYVIRRNVKRVIVHEEGDDWSADAEGEVVIHHGNFDSEAEDGALEESMFHEGVHTYLDTQIQYAHGWEAAQKADGTFISEYAKNTEGEDVAETFLLYYALATRPNRLSTRDRRIIEATIPNRLRYLADNFPPAQLGF